MAVIPARYGEIHPITKGVFLLLLRRSPLAVLSLLGLLLLLIAGCASSSASHQAAGSPSQPAAQTGSLSLSANSLNFNNVVIGQSGTQTLQLTNSGTAAVQITGISVSNPEFAFTGPSVPHTLPPSSSLSYTLSFTPAAPGNSTATLNISSNASNLPLAVSLAGSGEKAVASLALTPPSLNFGNQTVKTTTTQNVTLQNTGDVPVTIQGVTLAGGAFNYSNLSPGVALTPNQQITFQVSFTPTVAGAAAATMSLLSPSLSTPEKLSLSGDGVTGSSPAPPSPSSKHRVHLTWHPGTGGQVIGYIVYRSEVSGGSFSPLFGTAIPEVSYDDDSVSASTTYYYVVTAVDAAGVQSSYSNQATAAIP